MRGASALVLQESEGEVAKRRVAGLITVILAAMVFTVSTSALSQPTSDFEATLAQHGISIEDFDRMTTYYYQNPQPNKLISVVQVMLTQDEFLTDDKHFGPFAHLIATVAQDEPRVLSRLKDLRTSYAGPQRNAIEQIIREGEDFTTRPPDSPTHLDDLWAEFIATGREGPVKKIISALGYPETGLQILLVGAAEWSLTSNAKRHKKVHAIIEQEAMSASGQVKEKLDDILEKLKPTAQPVPLEPGTVFPNSHRKER